MACCSLQGISHFFFYFVATRREIERNRPSLCLTFFKRRTFKDQISREGFRALEHKARYVSRRILTKEHKGGRGRKEVGVIRSKWLVLSIFQTPIRISSKESISSILERKAPRRPRWNSKQKEERSQTFTKENFDAEFKHKARRVS